VLRIILTLFAWRCCAVLAQDRWASVLLLWIGVKLLVPRDEDPEVTASDNLFVAIRTILIADLV